MSLPLPVFISTDPAQVMADISADYELRTGKALEPGQAEAIILDILAYRETIIRGGIQSSAQQNLLAFASGVMLDYLADFFGLVRLAAAPASTTVTFTLAPGSAALTIPAGLRIRTTDGLATFSLLAAVPVDAGAVTATGIFVAQATGIASNAYAPGTVTVIMDPQPYLISVTNTNTTNGGSDQEIDDALRARIRLAPSAFSTAGPTGAYEFFARGAHPSIIDVSVPLIPVTPGVVDVYVLSDLGLPTPDDVIAAVTTTLNGEKTRPLNDIVHVHSPTVINFALVIDIVIYADAVQDTTEGQVLAAAQGYVATASAAIHTDIVLSQIERAIGNLDSVYDVIITAPGANVTTDETEIAICTGITVTTTGVH